MALTQLTRDWNQSWNDEMYRQRVVNLDGLINNFDLVPYRRVADYIQLRGIRYLADMGSTFHRPGAVDGLTLTGVYSSDVELMDQPYRIYRVD